MNTHASPARPSLALGWVASLASALPMILMLALLLLSGPANADAANALHRASTYTVWGLLCALFLMMLKTGRTDRFRSALFVTIAVSFVLTFIPNLLETRGNIALGGADMAQGKTPFCHMVIPMVIIPAALTKTIIFPGSMVSGFASIGSMLVLWLGASLCLGRGWCSWVCFFGGLDEGCSKLAPRKPPLGIDRRWTYLPLALLLVIVIGSAATLSPTYCEWLCPFKSVTEFEEVTGLRTLVQTLLFSSLFIGLVLVLPILTAKRTQCALFCPMGAFQGFTNRLNLHEVRVDRELCTDCGRCSRECPTLAITPESVAAGSTLGSCSKCGRCVDTCPRGALGFHLKGTGLKASPRLARVLFLYPAFLFLSTIGGGMMIGALERILRLLTTGSML